MNLHTRHHSKQCPLTMNEERAPAVRASMLVFAMTRCRQNIDLATHLDDHLLNCGIGDGRVIHVFLQIPCDAFAAGLAVGTAMLSQETLYGVFQ